MVKRRRYDTEALVGQLKAERRTGIALSLAAVGVLLLLVTLYVASGRGEGEEGAEGHAAANSKPTEDGKPPPDPPPAPPPPVAPAAEAPPPAETGPATVNLNLTKKGVVWLDKKKLGKFKKKQVELPAGKHELRAKVGKKTIKHVLDVKGGQEIEIAFDHKTGEAVVTTNK